MKQSVLTNGNTFKVLIKFSLPFLLANILQALYGAADLFMVGRFADSAAVSAVAVGGQVMQTITGLIIGLTTGGTVLIGQYFGARQLNKVANAVKTLFLVFALFAVVLTGATMVLAGPLCLLLKVPAAASLATKQYLFYCASGIIFIVGYNVISGILRGLGDSRTPLLFITIACILNIFADLFFVGFWGLGAVGAAFSTVIAQGVSLVIALIYLGCQGYFAKYRQYKPILQLKTALGAFSVGLPIALQEGLVNISFLIITAIINEMGLIASASVGVVEKLIVFSMLPTTAFAASIAAITAQHKGANLMPRAKKCLHLGILLSLFFGCGCFFLAQCQGPWLIRLFSHDPQVVIVATNYLRSYSIDCILVSFVFCMNAFFSGGGHPIFPLVHSFISTFFVRIPLSYVFCHLNHTSMLLIGLAAPAASLCSLFLCQIFMRRVTEPDPFLKPRSA